MNVRKGERESCQASRLAIESGRGRRPQEQMKHGTCGNGTVLCHRSEALWIVSFLLCIHLHA